MSVGTKTMDTEQMNDSTAEPTFAEVQTMDVCLGAEFSPEEQQVLASLRNRYEQGLDLFSERELAGLRFLRWLYQTGRDEA